MQESRTSNIPKYLKLRTHDPKDEKKKHISKFVQSSCVLGEDQITGAKEIIIAEGIPDWISAVDHGFRAISPGTTNFREADLARIAGKIQNNVPLYLIFDNEKNGAGLAGAKKTGQYLARRGLQVHLVTLPLPDGQDKIDLNEYLCHHSADDLKELMQASPALLDELIRELPEQFESALSSIQVDIAPILAQYSDGTLTHYAGILAAHVKTSIEAIKDEIRAARKNFTSNPKYQDPLDQVTQLNKNYAVSFWGSKAVIIHEHEVNGERRVDFLNEADFKLILKNRLVTDENGETVPLSQYWLRHEKRRQYEYTIFDPQSNSSNYFNLWTGFAVEPIEGDCSLYLDHMLVNICQGNKTLFDYLLAWMADSVQNPDRRPGVAVVLRGDRGTGKNIFVENFGKLFGPHFKQVTQTKHLTGNFNSHQRDCLILFANEAFWAGDKQSENVLKSLITEDTLMIELKGKDTVSMPNRMRIIMASNNDWIVPAGSDERRYFVLEVGNRNKQDTEYFNRLVDQMENGGREALLYYLLHYDLSGINLRQVPQTIALLEQKLKSLNSLAIYWYNCLNDGLLSPEHERWEGKIPTTSFFDWYIEMSKKSGKSHLEDAATFGKALAKLIPGLHRKRRIHSVGMKDGTAVRKKIWIYQFPSLDECRNQFEEYLSMKIEWSEVSDAEDKEDSTIESQFETDDLSQEGKSDSEIF